MILQLINEPNNKFQTLEQIFYNRKTDFILNYNDKYINDPEGLNENLLNNAIKTIAYAAKNEQDALLIVDSDCDGFCSASLFLNYFHKIFPYWVENHFSYFMHSGKQHGLSDCIDEAEKYDLIICLDSSSNNLEEHKKLYEEGKYVIVIDHHLANVNPIDYPYAIIINNQLSSYDNKELSGCGVTWQFCRFVDKIIECEYAEDFLDLVALSNVGDMMSLTSNETRSLVLKGFLKENIKNPFIDYMIDKNNFVLNKSDYKPYNNDSAITGIGAAFFIVPFINAITRSGTLSEKYLVFQSMLEYLAYKQIPEIKRGKKTGKIEFLVLQAVRTVVNVKNRQTRLEEAGLMKLEKIIKEKKLLDNKILLFLLQPEEINAEIRGLIANKMMAKYQRPCIITTYNKDSNTYDGSMRGYTKTGILSFKKILDTCPGIIYVEGHDNAAGISLDADKIDIFLEYINEILDNVSVEPVYYIDYLFDKRITDNDKEKIIEMSQLNDYIGQDFERPHVGIIFKITSDNFKIMKSNTLKIIIDDNLSIIKFGGTEEDINNFTTEGWIEVKGYCKCGINEWNGIIYPQLYLEDYEIIDSCKYIF